MLKRIVYLNQGVYLTTKAKQLVLQKPQHKAFKKTIPIEDIALVFLDDPQITLSHPLIQELLASSVALVSCNRQHMPAGLLLPLEGHHEMSRRWKIQTTASEILKKQLWKQTVEAKITNQRALLKYFKRPSTALDRYLEQIEPGDPTNIEGQAASYYWKALFPNFKRERDGAPPNHYLNFGYAILRSIVARALVCSGLLPAFGLFHHNKYNAFGLADDIMEPYRPYVDRKVYDWIAQEGLEASLSTAAKQYFLTLAHEDVTIAGKMSPLLSAASTTTAALYKCLARQKRTLIYPLLT